MTELLEETIAEYEVTFDKIIPEAQRKALTLPGKLSEFRQNARVGSLRKASRAVLRALNSKAVCFGIATRKQSFVLGSNPVLKITGGSPTPHLTDPLVEVWLPLHPQIMLAFAGQPGAERLVELPSHSVVPSTRQS